MSLPERLGRLRRIERIGAGGFATVWRYHDDELDSDVAVKALADNWAQRLDVRERFLAEARMLRKADADRVVRVYDIGETDDGTPYFVMSYADLGTVADLIQARAPLPVDEVLDIVRQAGSGISVLHHHGIVHRDIKPQNLLRKTDGEGGVRVMVADLGVAKATAHGSALTQIVGTPAYMAPEQVHGTGVDERADVHALAAVAYVLLTGHPVRDDTLNGLLTAGLPPPPSTFGDVPDYLDAPILKALEPEPENRFRSIDAFVYSLENADPDKTLVRQRVSLLAEPGAQSSALTLAPAEPGTPPGVAPRASRAVEPVTEPGRVGTTVLWFVLVLGAFFAAAFYLTPLVLRWVLR